MSRAAPVEGSITAHSDEVQPLQSLRQPAVDLPEGYEYGVTRGADQLMRHAHPGCFADIVASLEDCVFKVADMVVGGGNRSLLAETWDGALRGRGWTKRNVTVEKVVDGKYLSSSRSHEIDMFKGEEADGPYPGVAVEMEWSNKDPFFDRDLGAFDLLHREGIIDIGMIVTRGPELQQLIKKVVPGTKRKNSDDFHLKYGESTTHWRKLKERVERGGGGACPLLLVGIEPDRFDEPHRIREAHEELAVAEKKGKGAVQQLHAEILRRGTL